MRGNRFERVFSLCSGLALATVAAAACSGDAGISPGEGGESIRTASCQAIIDEVISASTIDGIPALQLRDSDLVGPFSASLDFLSPISRVIGLQVDGEYLAVPLNVLWWHEILNLNDHGLAITHCPLTGSSMVFERAVASGAEFGVSGMLFQNNLVMYDRAAVFGEETIWPQMLAGGFCGPSEGEKLTMVAAIEIEWANWLALHPDTRVVSGLNVEFQGSPEGVTRDYAVYPYGDYEVERQREHIRPPREP